MKSVLTVKLADLLRQQQQLEPVQVSPRVVFVLQAQSAASDRLSLPGGC